MRRHRSALMLTSLAVSMAAVPLAFGATTSVGASPAELSVTLMLAPQDRAALEHLATTSHIAPAERARALAHARPSAATSAAVVAKVHAAGLTIVSSSPFSVTARGAAADVTRLVGSRKALRTQPRSPAANSTNDGIPAPLRGLVAGIVGGDDTSLRLHPMASPVGATPASLTSLYHGVDGTPPSPLGPLTIATIQFSGWDSSDLTSYAADLGVPDPRLGGADAQYLGVSVDGADPNTPDGKRGDIEVALDQETLLGLAPTARQRAYVAPNNGQGFVDAIDAVTNDAAAHHIGALSISWGACEAIWSPMGSTTALDTMHLAFTNLLAAGVTVFAASGDLGFDDCGNSTFAVDYPASDPLVLGVGGTTVYDNGSQSVWDQGAGHAGGGGYSDYFATPDYQLMLTSPAAQGNSGSSRMVPDISAVGDPVSGLLFRYHNLGVAKQTNLGGTSLAAPVSTALFTNTLSTRGFQTGVGDIHANLYKSSAGSFYDVTTGGGGLAWPATAGYDLGTGLGTPLWAQTRSSYDGAPVLHVAANSKTRAIPLTVNAPAGMSYGLYRVGVGTPPTIAQGSSCPTSGGTAAPPTTASAGSDGLKTVWVVGIVTLPTTRCYLATATVLVDTVKPTATITAPAATFLTSTSTTLKWTRTDGKGSGIARTEYRAAKASATAATPANSFGTPTNAGTATSRTLTARSPGSEYCYQVRAVDKAGNVGAWSPSRCFAVPYDDRSFAASTGWSRGTASGYLAGTKTATATTARTLTKSSTRVRQIGLVAARCATCGSVQVFIGTTLVGTINLASATASRSLVLLPRFTTARTGVVKLVTRSNKAVTIDAVALIGH